MLAAGMEETAHLILMILGKTALRPCSAGATSTMGSVMASATVLGVSMMALIVRDRKDNASKSTKQRTMLKTEKLLNILGFVMYLCSCSNANKEILIQSPSFLPARCMTSTVKTTMLMVTVTRAATMQSVNGTASTVPTTCQKSWQTGT